MLKGFCDVCGKWAVEGEKVPCALDPNTSPPDTCGLFQPHKVEEITEDRPVTFDDAKARLISQAQEASFEDAWDAAVRDVFGTDTIGNPNPPQSFEEFEEEMFPKQDDALQAFRQARDIFERATTVPEATSYPDDNPKTVLGLSKPSITAVPPVALIHMGRAMSDGRRKYGLMNWRSKGVTTSIYVDAAFRHLMSFWDGEDDAQDSKVAHLGHVMSCCAIILDAASSGTLNDDRPVPGKFADTINLLTVKGN